MVDFIINHLGLIAIAICVLGALYGLRDFLRFSWTRVWAISGVCFAESIRRRVLWIAPLAMIAVVIVSGFINAVDQLDNIRQLTLYCVFACGLVVTVATLILACTNLPKEIENRVIFTIVTKPTTRLEIVVGKIVGFARVSGTILLIMGIFTFGFLLLRERQLRSAAYYASLTADSEAHRTVFKHYADAGLLHAQRFTQPDSIEMIAELPNDHDGGQRAILGGIEEGIAVPFDVTDAMRADFQNIADGKPVDLYIQCQVTTCRGEKLVAADWGQNTEAERRSTISIPKVGEVPINMAPLISPEIMDADCETALGFWQTGKPEPVLPVPIGSSKAQLLTFPPQVATAVASGNLKRFNIVVRGMTPGIQYIAQEIPRTPDECAAILVDSSGKLKYAPSDLAGHLLSPNFRGRPSQFGQQLRGGRPVWSPWGIARFTHAEFIPNSNGKVPFFIRVQVEGAGGETTEDQNTAIEISVLNRNQKFQVTPIATIFPDTRVQTFFDVPAALIAGGNFDIVMRCQNNEHWIALPNSSVQMVAADDSFALNLSKSLLVLWLLSVLVITISVFSSTFLSWPIAVVFTLLLLLGHWGVAQLSDNASGQINSNMGAGVVNDMFKGATPVISKTVKTTVDELTSMLNVMARVLPDVSTFSAMESIERGVSMPNYIIRDSMLMLVEFGVPLTVLAYLFLKNKEVAP